MHVGKHNVGYRCEINAGGVQSLNQPTSPRQVQGRIRPKPSVNEYGPAATTHDDHVQRPLEHFRRQELVLQPGRPDRRIDVVRYNPGRYWEHSIAYHHYLNLADPNCVARWNQLVEAGLCDVISSFTLNQP